MRSAEYRTHVERAARRLRERDARRQQALERRLEQARRDFDAIVEMLIRKYDPVRIWQWGSLVEGKGFSEISDIDIGVEGEFSPEQFFKMLGDAMNLARIPVHLVHLKDLHPAYAAEIRRKGRIVYERRG